MSVIESTPATRCGKEARQPSEGPVALFLLFGVYNKLVKIAGFDRTYA